jgi:hypothetical protein
MPTFACSLNSGEALWGRYAVWVGLGVSLFVGSGTKVKLYRSGFTTRFRPSQRLPSEKTVRMGDESKAVERLGDADGFAVCDSLPH